MTSGLRETLTPLALSALVGAAVPVLSHQAVSSPQPPVARPLRAAPAGRAQAAQGSVQAAVSAADSAPRVHSLIQRVARLADSPRAAEDPPPPQGHSNELWVEEARRFGGSYYADLAALTHAAKGGGRLELAARLVERYPTDSRLGLRARLAQLEDNLRAGDVGQAQYLAESLEAALSGHRSASRDDRARVYLAHGLVLADLQENEAAVLRLERALLELSGDPALGELQRLVTTALVDLQPSPNTGVE